VDVHDLAIADDGRRNLGDRGALHGGAAGASLHCRYEPRLDVEADWSFPWPASHGHDPLIGSGAFEVENVQDLLDAA
jgi:hypothetical protein